MRLTLDLGSNSFIQSSFSTVPQRNQTMVRASAFPIELQFVKDGVPFIWDDGAAIIKEAVKLPAVYDGDSLIPAATWARDGTNKLYTTDFNFITTALDDLFFVDGNTTNDVASLALTLGLAYSLDGGTTWKPSPSLPITLYNNKCRGDETSAAVLSNGLFNPFIATALSGGDPDDLDGIATVSLSVPKVIAVLIADELQFWQLKAGTDATATGIQRPADYADTTNEKVWFRLL